MNTLHSKMAACAALTLLACSAGAQTYTVKLGGGYIDPRATSDDLQGTVPPLPAAAYTLSPGARLAVQAKAAVLFSVVRALDDHWEAELLLGVPPKHDVKLRVSDALKAEIGSSNPYQQAVAAKLTAYDGQTVATVQTIAPTFFVNYKFLAASSAWRPYLGVGLNYTHFKARATSQGMAFYNDGPVKIELEDSYGPALQAGLAYQIDKAWSVNLGWSTTAIKNDLLITTNGVGSRQTGHYDFQPSVFSLMAGYSF